MIKKTLLLWLLALCLPVMAMADYNHAVTFTGTAYKSTGDRLDVPLEALGSSADTYSSSFSIGVWYRVTTQAASTATAATSVLAEFNAEDACNGKGSLMFTDSSYGPVLFGSALTSAGGTVKGKATSADKLTPKEWHFLVLTVDNENLKVTLYADGSEYYNTTLTQPLVLDKAFGNGKARFQFGSMNYKGAVDEVQFYNRALSAEEVVRAANSPKSLQGLTAMYDFQSTVKDTRGQFANLVTEGPAAEVNATFVSVGSGSYDGNGLKNCQIITESLPDLTTVTEDVARVIKRTLTVPSAEDYENLASLAFAIGEEVLTAGEVKNINDGTEITVTAAAAAGYVVAAVTVEGVDYPFSDEGVAQFPITSDLDSATLGILVTRTPYTVTLAEVENGEFFAKYDGKTLASGDKVPAGSTIELECRPASGYMLQNYTLDGEPFAGNSVETPAADCTIGAVFTAADYCASTATVTRGDRALNAIYVNGTEIAGPGSASSHPVYKDQTDKVITITAGDDIEFLSDGKGEWMHTYIYGDFDCNGWNVDTDARTPNGDLLWYTAKVEGSGSNERAYDMQGNNVPNVSYNISGIRATIPTSLDMLPGEYRMRYKVDWGSFDPCGNPSQAIHTNGGSIVDFTLRVESAYLDAPRTITLKPVEAAAGKVSFVDPAVKGLEITTDRKKVKVHAEPEFGATFNGWYKVDRQLSTAADYTITESTDAVIQAFFVWSAMFPVTVNQTEGGTLTVKHDNKPIASGDEVLIHETLKLETVNGWGHHLSHFLVNGVETTETEIEVLGETTIEAVFEEGVEYCEPTWTKGSTRKLASLDVCVEGDTTRITPSNTGSYVYSDQTATVVTAESGADVVIDFNGTGSWLHGYIFADFDNNGWNVDETINAPNGDLLWYNAYNMMNSDGETLESHEFNVNDMCGHFTVPAYVAPGNYRVRVKTDWNSIAPCGNLGDTGLTSGNNHIAKNCGNIIDFTLQVVEAVLDHERTITAVVAEGEEALGEVKITAPETEGTTVTTNKKYIGLRAVPAEGAQFMKWTDGEGEFANTADIAVTDTEDATYTAHFGWTVDYSATEGGNLQVRREGETAGVASGMAFTPGTRLTAVVEAEKGMALESLKLNGEPLDVVDGQVTFTVNAYTELKAEFREAQYELVINNEGEGTVEVWTDFNDDDSPAGTKLSTGSQLSAGDELNIYIMPNEYTDNSGEYEILTFLTITNGEGADIDLDNLEDFGWECEYDEHHFIVPIEVTGDVSIKSVFSSNLAAIAAIGIDGQEGPVEYYDIRGVRVSADRLHPGVYIMRQGTRSAKVYIFGR